MTLAALILAGHAAMFPIVKEHAIEEGTTRACRFHRVERCAGLSAPLPRLARTDPAPCPNDPAQICLPGSPFSGWYDIEHATIVLPRGRDDTYAHEAIHHLKWVNQGDISHDGPEWACQ